MRALLITLLVAAPACTDGGPTVRDAADELAVATCERFLECGWTTDDRFDVCVKEYVDFVCLSYDCDARYPDYDLVTECTDWYSELACSVDVHVCVL